MLSRNQSKVCHKLPGIVEAGEYSDLSDQCCGNDQAYAFESLKVHHCTCQGPCLRNDGDLILQLPFAGLGLLQSVRIALKRDLLRVMLEMSIA